jgi:hypothetical protein
MRCRSPFESDKNSNRVIEGNKQPAVCTNLKGTRLNTRIVTGQQCAGVVEMIQVPRSILPQSPLIVAANEAYNWGGVFAEQLLPIGRGGESESKLLSSGRLTGRTPRQDALPEGVPPTQIGVHAVEHAHGWRRPLEGLA